MSMQVDLSTPLTDEERAYLLSRGREVDVLRANDQFGTETDPELLAGDGTGTRAVPMASGEALAQRKEALLRELALIEQAEGGATDDEDEEADAAPYEEWKVAELDAELRSRGLPVTGDKRSKADALYADDERAQQPQS